MPPLNGASVTRFLQPGAEQPRRSVAQAAKAVAAAQIGR